MPDLLRCVTDGSLPVTVVRISGRLDKAGSARVRTALHRSLVAEPVAVAIDLSDLVATDDMALLVFPAAARAAQAWPGCPVLLYAPDTELRDVLHRLSVDRNVRVFDRWDDLLATARVMPPAHRYTRTMPARPSAAHAARELVAAVCRTWQLNDLVDDAELIVTELVTNAVRHVGGEMVLTVVVDTGCLHLSVRDHSAAAPGRRSPDPVPELDENGRGLMLIDVIATGWGSTFIEDGKVVWATLRAPGPRPDPPALQMPEVPPGNPPDPQRNRMAT